MIKLRHLTQTLLVVTLIWTSSLTFGQKLVTNKIDGFTNSSIKRTSYERLNWSTSFVGYFRISKINENTYFDLKMMINTSVFSINKGQEIMFKFFSGEIIKLPNIEYAITCTGCGAKGFAGSEGQGIKVSYILEKEQFEKLKNNIVETVRIYTTDGYVESSIAEKYYKKLQKALILVE